MSSELYEFIIGCGERCPSRAVGIAELDERDVATLREDSENTGYFVTDGSFTAVNTGICSSSRNASPADGFLGVTKPFAECPNSSQIVQISQVLVAKDAVIEGV